MPIRQTNAQTSRSEICPQYEIGFDAPGDIADKKPLHEIIAIAALIQSNLRLPPTVNYYNLDQQQWEYIRGLIWNDDPSCLLLDDKKDDNHDFGYGLEWWQAFRYGPESCMTKRSHFGDLQFLHGMATKVGEPAQTTKDSLMTWLEVMYRLASGDQEVSSSDRLTMRFPKCFGGKTDPSGNATLKDLIVATTPRYKSIDISRRALGICLHIIQDSYAVGHSRRRLLNPWDLAPRDQKGHIQFKSGTFGIYGPILAFHTYRGQNDGRHSHYDAPQGDLPVPKDLNSFNKIIGSRNAIDASTKLINFSHAKTKWHNGVQQFLADEVFALDPHVQPANTEVDEERKDFSLCNNGPLPPDQTPRYETGMYADNEYEYGTGLTARKLDLLDSEKGERPIDVDVESASSATEGFTRPRWHGFNCAWSSTGGCWSRSKAFIVQGLMLTPLAFIAVWVWVWTLARTSVV